MTDRTIDPAPPTALLLEGRWTDGRSRDAVRDPYTGEVIAEVAGADPADVERAVAFARRALARPMPLAERAAVLEEAARRVADDIERLARLIALEAGKPVAQARGEAGRAVETLRFSCAAARELGGEVVPMEASAYAGAKLGLAVREPIGVVGAISPFNFPLNLVAHKLAPAIAAGCPVVLKPAGQTPLSALALAEILRESGLPDEMLQVLPGDGATVGGALVDSPGVALISFTGSPAVGWGIRARAPRKEVELELGNSTPVIVCADADLDAAVARVAATGYTHAGQSCISVQRVYVERSVHAAFLDRLVERVRALRVGDPLEEATDVGPVIDARSRERVLEWVREAVDGGAEVLTGGPGEGPLIEPMVLSGIAPDMRASRGEMFGPVVGVAPFDTPDEAIALANSTPYGLQAGIFTARVDRALVWARSLRFGGVTINESPTFRADQMPYGGIGDSGNTREGPRYAIERMTERKLVVVQLPTG